MKKYTLLYIGATLFCLGTNLALCSCNQSNKAKDNSSANTQNQKENTSNTNSGASSASTSSASNANIITKQIPIGAEFTHLIAVSGADIVYTQGDYKMDAIGDSSILEFLEADIESGILTISIGSERNQDINFYEGKQNVTINLSAPNLKCVSICSSGNFTSKGLWKSDKIEFGVIGDGNFKCDSIICQFLDYQATGNGNANFAHIKSQKLRFTNTSGSNINADIDTDIIIADNQGNSTFKFTGKANSTELYPTKKGKILF